MNKFSAPKGTFDILPNEVASWQACEKRAREIAHRYGYGEIRTPEFENVGLFNRAVGETTDIVQKEMFTFATNEKETFALKPEGTAGVMRSFIENGMASLPSPVKLYYLTSCYRHEKPQKGRQRQFHQFGVEAIGSVDPAMDAEVITLCRDFIDSFSLENIELKINSIGCKECRPAYYEKLRTFLADKRELLCEDCQRRLDTNPLRVLDCKNEKCKELTKDAPLIIDNLCDSCRTDFEKVKEYLKEANVAFTVDPLIVRGLDYYTGVAFEFICNDLGSQSALGGGGRYNGLISSLGGGEVPGVGFALGMERLMIALNAQNKTPKENQEVVLYFATMNEEAKKQAFSLCRDLRKEGISCLMDTMQRSLKAQMKYSDKVNARYTVMIGEDEMQKGVVALRDMQTKEQTEIKSNDFVNYMKDKMKEK